MIRSWPRLWNLISPYADTKEMARHIIFDLDGTLVDSSPVCCDILNQMRWERGGEDVIDAIAARPWMSVGGTQMVAALLGSLSRDLEDDIVEFRKRYALVRSSPKTLFPHVRHGLSKMKDAGFVLSICSNKPQNLVENVLRDTGIMNFFDGVMGQREGLRPKPAPDMLYSLLDEISADPQKCIFVGDSGIDHQVASRVGMDFLFVTYGYAETDYRWPQLSFDSFRSLTEAVIQCRYI